MLSKLTTVSLLRRFSTTIAPVSHNSVKNSLTANHGETNEGKVVTIERSSEVQQFLDTERQHLNYVVNELKTELNEKISINFQTEVDKKTLILETETDSANYWKLGEVITAGSVAALVNEILGFPSYGILGATLGAAGLGAAWSYGNFLRRSSSQITKIYRTSEGKLHVYSLKPKSLLGRVEVDEEVEVGNFRVVSFCGFWMNWLRKANHTNWVSVNGKLYWYNANPTVLRTNSHFYSSLI